MALALFHVPGKGAGSVLQNLPGSQPLCRGRGQGVGAVLLQTLLQLPAGSMGPVVPRSRNLAGHGEPPAAQPGESWGWREPGHGHNDSSGFTSPVCSSPSICHPIAHITADKQSSLASPGMNFSPLFKSASYFS